MKKVLTLLLAIVLAIGLTVPAAVMAASVTPVLVGPWISGDAEFECGQIGSGADYAYKVEPWYAGDPSGEYYHAGNTITITAYDVDDEYKTFDWESEFPVVAVIVKAGTQAYVYWYYGAYSDTGLYAPGGKGVSHATFCFNEPVVTQATLSVIKFYDANANGVVDEGEFLLDDWYFTIGEDLYSTPFSDIVDAGTYIIAELTPNEPNWVASGITVDGTEDHNVISDTEVEVSLADGGDVTVYFGNYCLVPSGGMSPGYWGQVIMSKGKNPVPTDSRRISSELYAAFDEYITDVNSVTLVNNDGSDAEFDNALELSQWIGSGLNAQNMAAQLSRHTAAMILNILSGAVDGEAYYIPAEMTVQEVLNAAKAALNDPAATRKDMETLKDWLDELNNGANVIPTEPCPYTFTLPEP